MTHICINKLTIIGSDNGLSPGRRQAIIWTNAGILLIGPLGTNFSEILIEIITFSFKKMHLKMLSVKWRPSCLGLNVLRHISPYQGTQITPCPNTAIGRIHFRLIFLHMFMNQHNDVLLPHRRWCLINVPQNTLSELLGAHMQMTGQKNNVNYQRPNEDCHESRTCLINTLNGSQNWDMQTTSWYGDIFDITDTLCRKSTGHQ